MIRIETPQLSSTRVGNPMADGSAQAGHAQALGELAQGLAAVGGHFTGIALHAQQLKNAEQESEARAGMATAYQQFENDLQSDTDPDSRSKKRADFLAGLDSHIPGDAPPAVRDALAEHLNQFRVNASANGLQSDFQLREKRTKLAFDNEIQTAIDSGNAADATSAIDRAVSRGVILPEQATAAKSKLDLELKTRAMQAEILADPVGWLEKNPADKVPAGFNPASWTAQRNFAQAQEREKTYDKTQLINDGIVTGHISTPEQIDSVGGDLRPSTRDEIKQSLAHRTLLQSSAAEKARVASPEYQQQVVGQVAAMLQNYQPEAENFDTQFVQMDALIKTLPSDSAVRDELTRNIDSIRKGETPGKVTNHFDAGAKALGEAFKGGKFGADPAGVSTARQIDAGFLNNGDNLKQLGFSAAQATEIMSAKSLYSEVPTNPARADKFRRLWEQRANKDGATANPYARRAAEAILNHSETIAPDDSSVVAAKMQAELNYGRVLEKYAEFKKLNPKATAQEVDDKVFELAGEEARKSAASGKWETAPTRGSTAAGDRVTSYGYIGDSTPDGNSKVGIGAWVGNAEAEKIRRGENTPNKLQPGDLAVSRDVEARLRAAGVSPGDTITLNLADGSTKSVRWMDRTAESYQGRTLTNRFDLYSPDGKSPLDGAQVVGWSRNFK